MAIVWEDISTEAAPTHDTAVALAHVTLNFAVHEDDVAGVLEAVAAALAAGCNYGRLLNAAGRQIGTLQCPAPVTP
jgi:hypothetical protein